MLYSLDLEMILVVLVQYLSRYNGCMLFYNIATEMIIGAKDRLPCYNDCLDILVTLMGYKIWLIEILVVLVQ